jgi:predicted small secreted protein
MSLPRWNDAMRGALVACRRHAWQHFQENIMRKFMGLAAIAGALLISACNTVEGMGRDVESAGHTVAKTADRSK